MYERGQWERIECWLRSSRPYVPVAPVFTCYDIAIHVKRPLRNTYVYPIAIDL